MNEKILVVDDEQRLVEMLKTRLEANHYQVITAFDGQEALKKAREEKPDLMILDLMLPKLDGYQVCRLLKFDKTMDKTPIIMLTALGQRDDREWGKKVNADAYITKPFEAEELLECIRRLITKTGKKL
ncbi:MAG: response regulator [Candidatus Omnitrophota bacterium]|nr:response regulator [Candidatus Omnitrophota bacterium]